jgi:hypothetical protein
MVAASILPPPMISLTAWRSFFRTGPIRCVLQHRLRTVYSEVRDDVVLEPCPRIHPRTSGPKISEGKNHVRSIIPAYFLNEGEYRIRLMATFHCAPKWLAHPERDGVRNSLSPWSMGPGESPYWNARREGELAPLFTWERMG